MDLSEEVEKLRQQAAERFQQLLVKVKAWFQVHQVPVTQDETEQKSYDPCLEHVEELESLIHQWGDREILTRTQLAEVELTVPKVGRMTQVARMD